MKIVQLLKNNKRRPFLFPILCYVALQATGVLLVLFLSLWIDREFAGLSMRVCIALFTLILIKRHIRNSKLLFKWDRPKKEALLLVLFLLSLFALNNYFLANYSENVSFMKGSSLTIILVGFLVNSFYEEFIYRGLIQSYVNQNVVTCNKSIISRGNIVASILMLVSHVGFFMVMDLLFAITGLLLVFVFSVTTGYLRDKGASLWFVVIVHTLANFIHLAINLQHYLP